MKQLIITNNPKTAEYIEQQRKAQQNGANAEDIELIFCASREELYIQVRNYIHRNWKLQNHAMYGNIQLHKQPYRTMLLNEGITLDTPSLQLWEQAMERVKRNKIPNYSEKILEDFQVLDFSLFSSVVSYT